MNTEYWMKLRIKEDKAVYSQTLQLPAYLKEDLNVELALIVNMG